MTENKTEVSSNSKSPKQVKAEKKAKSKLLLKQKRDAFKATYKETRKKERKDFFNPKSQFRGAGRILQVVPGGATLARSIVNSTHSNMEKRTKSLNLNKEGSPSEDKTYSAWNLLCKLCEKEIY